MSHIDLYNIATRNYPNDREAVDTQTHPYLRRTDIGNHEVEDCVTQSFLSGDGIVGSEFGVDNNTIFLRSPKLSEIWVDDRNINHHESFAITPKPQIDANLVSAPRMGIPEPGDEELVTVPISKLQQLVEYGIQVLRESRRIRNIGNIDLEYNAASVPEAPSVPNIYETRSEVPRSKGCPKYLDEFLARACANPWPVRKIELNHDQVLDLDHLGKGFNRFNRLQFENIWNNHFKAFFGYGQRNVSATEMVRRGWFWKRILKECDKEMVPWLLEIGTDDPDARAAVLVKILICIVKESSEKRFSTTSTIGAILEQCYAGGVLNQPEDAPRNPENMLFHTELRQDYGIHIILIAISLNIFNDCLTEDNSDLGHNNHQILWSPMELLKSACGGANLEQILAFQAPELVVSILSLSRPPKPSMLLDCPTTASGRIDDLNIGTLRTIGDLRIVWTDIFEEHLLLNHQKKCLKIVRLRPFIWGRLSIFQKDCTRWSDIYRPPQELSVLKELKADIEKTWAILFSISTLGESPKTKTRVREKLRQEYETIIDEDQNLMNTHDIQILKNYHMPWVEDDLATGRVQSYYESQWDNLLGIIKSKQDKSTIAYSNFGMFENRVRELRQYMDNQKPHGLRQLLRDSRDALNYYTFMGVIIFGLLTVFLALASFLVGVAQTYAAFKALDMPS